MTTPNSLFVARMYDRADAPHLRAQFIDAHRAWLASHRTSILVAGSLRENAGAAALGGLWIVSAATKEMVEQLIHQDPFWREGLRERFEILHYSTSAPFPGAVAV